MSTGSVSSNQSGVTEQTELGWKEGHILKGLKRLQMHAAKEASSPASVPHCKDCMTSNEGIYSFGVKCGLQGPAAKQVAPTSKPLKAEPGFGDESRRGSDDQPTKELLCLEKLDVTKDDDGNFQDEPVKLAGDCGLFPSPITDNFLFLGGPTVKPGLSPTGSLTEQKDKDSLEKHKVSGDRNNNQERSADRKSRLDHKAATGDGSSSVQHSATRALSCMTEARQRSSSMEVGLSRDQASQAGGEGQDCPQRKPKPQPCDSARKAFILRSKSADAGPEQTKHTHSPLHQKLIKGHKSQEQATHAGIGAPSKRTNLNKTQGSSKGVLPRAERDEETGGSSRSKSLESGQQHSPLASPVKQSKTFKPPGVGESSKSPTKTRPQSSSDSVEESIYDNLPCSPRKQRRQDQPCEGSGSEPRSPSPPLPPGRSTSLLLRPGSDSLPKAGQGQSSSTGKITSSTTKTHQVCSALESQQYNTTKDNQHNNPPFPTHASKIPPSSSAQSPLDRTATYYDENGTPSVLPILQRSQQSISEPKLSEVLPQAYSNVYYHGIASNSQTSTSRAVKMALPLNAKSHEAIPGQETSTFLIFGRQNRDETNSTTKNLQTFQTFTCDPQMIHDHGGRERARRKIETRCNSLDSEPSVQPVASDSGVMLDWGFDEEGWLFKRSVSVSTRPLLKPVMGMNGAKARSQSFGARYMDRPSFNRSGKVRTQIKTHSGSSLNSLGDVLPGSMSCSSSYHCPMNRSLLNNFLIEEGLTAPSHLGSSSERLQSLKLQREHARRLQIEQQFSSAFGEPVSEEPERQSTITTIEEKVMLGIEENLHKTQEQERSVEVKQKSGSTLANWFGFRKSKLPAPSGKKAEPPKAKEEKREQKITSLLGGKQTKADKKRDRRKSDGKDW